MNRLSHEKRAEILDDMVESKSLRGISRTRQGNRRRSSTDRRRKRVSLNAVYKLLREAGDTAIDFLTLRLRCLPCTRLEADEAYAWVYMHPRTAFIRKIREPGKGMCWIWVAIDPVSKLVVAWHVGSRGKKSAKIFMEKVARSLSGRIQLTTDCHAPYKDGVDEAFGEGIDYARVKKEDEEEARFRAELRGMPYRRGKQRNSERKEKSPPEIVKGNPNLELATTNHIESFFQKLRQNMRRLVRRTTGYSKSIENLNRAIALYIFHYNFCRIHWSLGTTPAIEAGIEDSAWEWEDFLDLTDDFISERRKHENGAGKLDSTPNLVPPHAEMVDTAFVVYESFTGEYAKIHKAGCPRMRNRGPARSDTNPGKYWESATLPEALQLAVKLGHADAEQCRICLG